MNYVIVGCTPNKLLETRYGLKPQVANLNGVIRVKLSKTDILNFRVGRNYYIMDSDAFNQSTRLINFNRPSTLVELTDVTEIKQLEYPYLNTWEVLGARIVNTKDI